MKSLINTRFVGYALSLLLITGTTRVLGAGSLVSSDPASDKSSDTNTASVRGDARLISASTIAMDPVMSFYQARGLLKACEDQAIVAEQEVLIRKDLANGDVVEKPFGYLSEAQRKTAITLGYDGLYNALTVLVEHLKSSEDEFKGKTETDPTVSREAAIIVLKQGLKLLKQDNRDVLQLQKFVEGSSRMTESTEN